MAGRVQNLHKFKHFYDLMDFSQEQRLTITKSIIELTVLSESCEVVKKRSTKIDKFSDDTVVFSDNERCDLPSNHN